MNRGELVAKISEKHGISSAAATAYVKDVIEAIAAELGSGGKVSLAGLGNFSIKERAARQGRNPQTGETVEVPAKKAVKFVAATAILDSLNSN